MTPGAATATVIAAHSTVGPDLLALGGYAGAFSAIVMVIVMISRWITRDQARDITAIRHKVNNHATKLDALSSFRTQDVEIIVKLELGQAAIEKGQERIEKMIERNHHENQEAFRSWKDELAESIREIRVVTPRP